MTDKTTKIDLPPPGMVRRGGRSRFPRWVAITSFILALVIGVGTGVFLGLQYSKGTRGDNSGRVVDGGGSDGLEFKKAEIGRQLAAARTAIAQGDWFLARELFRKVKEIDPGNADALASLPLIDSHLDSASGTLVVNTNPKGAVIKIRGFGARQSPARFVDIPLGNHELEISLDGYETVTRNVELKSEDEIKLPLISLSRITGKLKVVSEPRGADFKLLKADAGNGLKKLVEVGKTPATIEKLDPGEYHVLMEVEGWPEYSELIRVKKNRNASVSAVFASGGVNVTSDPAGAEVWVKKGKDNVLSREGVTPITVSDLPVGRHQIELRYQDWQPILRTVNVTDGVTQNLEFSWEPSVVNFESDPKGAEVYLNSKRLGDGRQVTPFSIELPAGNYIFTARHRILGSMNTGVSIDPDAESTEARFSFDYGSVKIESDPSGAAVISNGVPLGRTPLTLPVVRPGSYTYVLSKERYVNSSVSGQLQAGGSLDFNSRLKYDPAPSSSKHFVNGFRQSLVWFGSLGGWVDSKEVTQDVYEKVMGGPEQNPSSFKAPSHPVDSVTWYKAVQFTEKLTILERGLGNLPAGYRYRLPTDLEWSEYVGKQDLNDAVTSVYERLDSTRPVGSMKPNNYGLFDVRGNVWEWCSDWYSQSIVNRLRKEGASANPQWIGTERKVLRGGAWNRSSQYDLSIANRRGARPSTQSSDIGFRVVLMRD